MEIKYGQFVSEKDNPKYSDTRHFFVLIESALGFHLSAGFTNYNYSCHFSDVVIHYHKDKNDGDACSYSPTGFCHSYDQIRWDSFPNSISDRIAVEILLERIEEALRKNNSDLLQKDADAIRGKLNFFEIWEDSEK